MKREDDVKVALCDSTEETGNLFEIFGESKELNLWDIEELDEISRTFVEDVMGYISTAGGHFNLYVMNNNPPATMLVSLLKMCRDRNIELTIHYWNENEKMFVKQEW